jgi:hypothetical protein
MSETNRADTKVLADLPDFWESCAAAGAKQAKRCEDIHDPRTAELCLDRALVYRLCASDLRDALRPQPDPASLRVHDGAGTEAREALARTIFESGGGVTWEKAHRYAATFGYVGKAWADSIADVWQRADAILAAFDVSPRSVLAADAQRGAGDHSECGHVSPSGLKCDKPLGHDVHGAEEAATAARGRVSWGGPLERAVQEARDLRADALREAAPLANDGIRTETDAMGGTTTIIPPAMARRNRELQRLLVPDHNCTGSGGIGQRADGSHTSYHRPCRGCVKQRERVFAQLGIGEPTKSTAEPTSEAPSEAPCDVSAQEAGEAKMEALAAEAEMWWRERQQERADGYVMCQDTETLELVAKLFRAVRDAAATLRAHAGVPDRSGAGDEDHALRASHASHGGGEG